MKKVLISKIKDGEVFKFINRSKSPWWELIKKYKSRGTVLCESQNSNRTKEVKTKDCIVYVLN